MQGYFTLLLSNSLERPSCREDGTIEWTSPGWRQFSCLWYSHNSLPLYNLGRHCGGNSWFCWCESAWCCKCSWWNCSRGATGSFMVAMTCWALWLALVQSFLRLLHISWYVPPPQRVTRYELCWQCHMRLVGSHSLLAKTRDNSQAYNGAFLNFLGHVCVLHCQHTCSSGLLQPPHGVSM